MLCIEFYGEYYIKVSVESNKSLSWDTFNVTVDALDVFWQEPVWLTCSFDMLFYIKLYVLYIFYGYN